jgi:hypothetical protein
VLGWLVAAALFWVMVVVTGPAVIDTQETTYPTWSIAHGQIACAYPSVIDPGEPPAAPLYPLLSGGIVAVAGLGYTAPFHSAAALGPGCEHGPAILSRWGPQSGALIPTTRIGSVSWLALMAGVVAWLRASGRGRRWWEPLTLIVVALLLPVLLCVQTFFHPQDLLALGLSLLAMVCARRDRWLLVGMLLALAILSQQYALLISVPVFVLAPAAKKVVLTGAAVVTGAIVVLPLAVLTSGRVIRAIALGTGDHPLPGGTVLWETHAGGVAGLVVYRIAPVAVAALLAWWSTRRLGSRALDPVPFMALAAVALGLRLVFEVNMFWYYYAALAVTLVLLEATQGCIRRTVVAWIAGLTLVISVSGLAVFGPTRSGFYLQHDILPILIGGGALLAILMGVMRAGNRRNLWPWVAVVAVDLFTLLPGANAFSTGMVVWFWQVVLVVPGVLLAAEPLLRAFRSVAPQRVPGVAA